MQRVTVLKDIGKGKPCIIIGGGTSVETFDFSKVRNTTVISVNNSIPNGVDVEYVIYNDACFTPVLKEYRLWESHKVIAYCGSMNINCQYYYRPEDCLPAIEDDNTGLKSLIIARNILGFEKIYLVGFDFYTVNVNGKLKSHFYGDEVGHNKKYECDMNLKNHYARLPKMIAQFDKVADMPFVYNCNQKSELGLYPHAMPW